MVGGQRRMQGNKILLIEGVVWRVERVSPAGFYGYAWYLKSGERIFETSIQPSVPQAQAELKAELCRLLRISSDYSIESASGAFLN